MRLFLDANVLFSAAIKPEGRTNAVFRLAEVGLAELVTSPYAVLEATRNVQAKFPDSISSLETLLEKVRAVAEADPELVAWSNRYLPNKDAPILAAAISSAADILVTGDRKHFGGYYGKELWGVLVLSPAETLSELLENE